MPGIHTWRGGAPVVLFANPTAQSGRGEAHIRDAQAALDAAGVPHRFVATRPEGETVDVVRDEIDGGARVVIAMGGDGTFAEVAKGVLASAHAPAVAMGLLPIGTANDQAKSFGMAAGPGALAANVATIAAGRVAAIDAGRIEVATRDDRVLHRDLFFDSASIGFGAAALITRNRDREAVGRIPLLGLVYRDMLVYVGAVTRRFVESYVADIKFDLEADIDNVRYHFDSLFDVVVKNTRVFGGEWVLDPESRPDDGVFELFPITGRRDLTSKLFASLRHLPVDGDTLRDLGLEHSEAIRGRRFVLTVTQPGSEGFPAAQIDGEEIPAGQRYRIEVLPRCLNVVVPRERST